MNPRLADIKAACCDIWGISLEDIASARRHKHLVEARFAYALLAREMTTQSCPAIGRELGGRDHTTILHALSRAVERLSDPEFSGKVDRARTATLRLAGHARYGIARLSLFDAFVDVTRRRLEREARG